MDDTERLAALLHEVFPPATTDRWPFTIEDVAARLHAAGVRVTGEAGLDVERLARLPTLVAIVDDSSALESMDEIAAILAREYAALEPSDD